jgi:hypothetical protein
MAAIVRLKGAGGCTVRLYGLPLIVLALAAAGCSGGQGVSTASILGSASAGGPAEQAAPATSDPTSRAFLVGSVSARAVKCGYNFDPAKLKTSYLASEASLGASSEQIAKLEQVYAVAYGGVSKGAADEPNYCNDARTKEIKADLTRLLAGDYNPPQKKAAKQDDGGFFSSLFDNDGTEEKGPKFGSSDWWESQSAKSGGH